MTARHAAPLPVCDQVDAAARDYALRTGRQLVSEFDALLAGEIGTLSREWCAMAAEMLRELTR